MNYNEILIKFPELKKDIQSILEWYSLSYKNRNTLLFKQNQEPILKFKNQIEEMIFSLKKFPNDLRRIKKIYRTLKFKSKLYPIFVDKNDNFILEGRHRIVAQYLLKLKIIDVIYVLTKENLNEILFKKIEDVRFESLDNKNFKYNFSINDINYVVNFDNISKSIQKEDSWSISFKFLPKLDGYNINNIVKYLTTNPYSNSGLNVEYKVYSYVISSILEFIKKFKPFLLFFDARDKKRYKIYEKITSNLLKDLNNYELHSGEVINGIYSFVIIKKNNENI